ncbi:hypothetical protein EV401DRAFT_1978476 [Pisolithus croceorrhizus]|nr:hypothetical protein EV401DRAFT_1978476 [Pisolithus croceorrhizus]
MTHLTLTFRRMTAGLVLGMLYHKLVQLARHWLHLRSGLNMVALAWYVRSVLSALFILQVRIILVS